MVLQNEIQRKEKISNTSGPWWGEILCNQFFNFLNDKIMKLRWQKEHLICLLHSEICRKFSQTSCQLQNYAKYFKWDGQNIDQQDEDSNPGHLNHFADVHSSTNWATCIWLMPVMVIEQVWTSHHIPSLPPKVDLCPQRSTSHDLFPWQRANLSVPKFGQGTKWNGRNCDGPNQDWT